MGFKQQFERFFRKQYPDGAKNGVYKHNPEYASGRIGSGYGVMAVRLLFGHF
jgi:hypothetical protein